MLVGVEVKRQPSLWTLEDSLQELGMLARTAGAEVVGTLIQRLDRPMPSYLGKGKLQELKELHNQCPYDTVLIDDDLTPSRQRNLERALEAKVIDRTGLILDVFARHAQTHEGRLQVELAQHKYLLPRLVGQWSHLERLGGGIGTRGPGETQLETDRRIIERRIQKLEVELEEVRHHRSRYRSRRKGSHLPVVSLVGYTNAGKSSLLNALSDADVLVQDQLFSTLDPVTRRVRLPSGDYVLLTDTVGFIQKLPPMVVAAFRATLEELQEADVILHVIDITHPNAAEQAQVVDDILRDLGVHANPRALAFNKADLLVPGQDGAKAQGFARLPKMEGRSVLVSALKGWGLDRLLKAVQQAVEEAHATEPAFRP